MTATNGTTFNRYSANIAEDGAVAVFDLLPDAALDFDAPGNDDPRPSGADFLSNDYKFYEVPSSHCTKKASAYYVNNRITQYTEFPSVTGIPMNYGGSPRARYKALSDDIIGEEPMLLIPSFGMTHDYIDRAKSLEMWINLEPYAQAVQDNLFSDPISELTWDDGLVGGAYTGGPVTLVTDGSEYPSSNPLAQTISIAGGTDVVFTDKVRLSGTQTYTYSFAASGPLGSILTTKFSVLVDGVYATYEFDTPVGNVGASWETYEVEFSIDESIIVGEASYQISTSETIKFSSPYLVSKNSDTVETLVAEQTIVEFGGIGGSSVKLTADSDFMYLKGYGNVASFQVGEWARPMYVVFVDNDKTFDVYVDCSPVMSISKDDSSVTYGNVVGEWIVMYLGESFKYMDLSTVSIYDNALGQDIQRIHNLFGYGPKYNDVITQTSHDKIYVADGSATGFASQVLFPQTTPFNTGTSFGLDVSNKLALPDYELPKLINGSYDNVNLYNHSATDGFGPRVFAFPTESEAVLKPNEIADNPEYLAIMVSPYFKAENMLTVNQATVEESVDDFHHANNVILTRAWNGEQWFLQVTTTDIINQTFYVGPVTDGPTYGSTPVVAGLPYTFRLQANSFAASDAHVFIRWFTSDHTTPAATSVSVGAAVTLDPVDSSPIYITATAPADAAYASFGFQVDSGGNGDVYSIDNFGFYRGTDTEFIHPNDAAENYESGLICRIKSDTLGISTDITYSAVVGNDGLINVSASTVNLLGGTGDITYDEYGNIYPSYEADPGYKRTTYTQLSGLSPAWFDQQISRQNFLLVLNLEKLRASSNTDVAALFNESSMSVNFNDTAAYTYISVCTKEAMYGNEIIPVGEDFAEVEIVATDVTGTTGLHIVGNATYAMYSNGNELDVAANGQWYVSIPLTNFATYVDGSPDLDFIIYSDQTQSPQLVNSLKTDVMSYSEFQAFVDSEVKSALPFNPEFTSEFLVQGEIFTGIAEYSDVQRYADDGLLAYDQMGLDVYSSSPTLGRFAGASIKTYVTLDSPSRWPDKDYADLKLERASYRGYIDFESSPNSVVDTKWELFDGFAIRVPKGFSLEKYNIGIGVHLSSMSLMSRKPTYRRCDLFGVASGDSPSNQISVGSGSTIVVGDMDDVNVGRPFSTHLPTETLPTNYMSRELGFYPHSHSDTNEISAVNFYLSRDDEVKGISFYMNWRSETFRLPDALSGVTDEVIARIKYTNSLAADLSIDLSVNVPLAGSTTPWIGELVMTPNTNTAIYVDGVLSPTVEAGRWHMVYIDLTSNGTVPLSDGGRNIRLQHINEKAVLNYIASHSVALSPSNLYAARFGGTDESVFADDFSSTLHYGQTESLTMSDSAEIFYVSRKVTDPLAGGAVADQTVTVYFDDTTYVV